MLQASTGLARDDFTLSLSADLVSIDAEDADLRLVLQELSRQSGIRIWISDNLPMQAVTIHFNDKPMSVTLRRLLKDSNYAAVYGDNNAITALYILAPGTQQSDFIEPTPGNGDDGQQPVPINLQSAAQSDGSEASVYGNQALEETLQSMDSQYGNVSGVMFDQSGGDAAEAQSVSLSQALGEIDQTQSLDSPGVIEQLREQAESGNLQSPE